MYIGEEGRKAYEENSSNEEVNRSHIIPNFEDVLKIDEELRKKIRDSFVYKEYTKPLGGIERSSCLHDNLSHNDLMVAYCGCWKCTPIS